MSINVYSEEMIVKVNWAKMILRLRAKLDVSQVKLGKMLNVSLASVSRWERGEHEPTTIAKVKLEDLFKVNNIEIEEVDE